MCHDWQLGQDTQGKLVLIWFKNSILYGMGTPNKAIGLFYIKGVMAWSMVDALSELCSSFLKGGNSVFIAAIASDLFHKMNISHWNNCGPNGKKMGTKY